MKAVTVCRPNPDAFGPRAHITHIKHRKYLSLLLLLALLILQIPLASAHAEESGGQLPQPWQEFYYYDEANVLGEITRADILSRNTQLNEQYGVQIVVMTVNALPAGDYSQRVAYLRQIASGWQIGGSDGRGLLLALSIGDQDYLAVAGDKLKASFTTDSLKALLDAQLEPDFSTGAYEAGAAKFFTAAAAQAESYCAANPEAFSQTGETSSRPASTKKKDTGSQVLLIVCIAAAVIAVVCIAIFLLMSGGGNRRRRSSRYGGYGVHRGRPVITPPRTNVLHYESRPTLHIRSSSRSTGVYRNQKSTRSRTNIDRRS